jgi:hypothetical protein
MPGRKVLASYSLLPQQEEDVDLALPGPSSNMAASSTQAKPHDEYEMTARKDTRVSIGEVPEKSGFEAAIMEAGDDGVDATASTGHDRFQMDRMGKKQVLVRRFRPMSTFAFNAMATSVWEFGIFSVTQGLVDGGRAGLWWTTVIHAIGFLPIGMRAFKTLSNWTNKRQFFPWLRWRV